MNNNIETKDDKINEAFQGHKLVIASELINKAYNIIASNCDEWGAKTLYENRNEKQRALQNLNETHEMIANALQIGGK